MKISLMAANGGWHANQIKRAAKKIGVKLEILRISNINDCAEILDKTGDVIIWFSSCLKKLDREVTLFGVMEDKLVINTDNLKWPFLSRKLFQQKYLETSSNIKVIPTFTFQNKKELLAAIPDKLSLPIIQKINCGSRGNGISLLKTKRDILKLNTNLEDYVYQNYISNDGDYRVLIVGGKALGAIKRTAKYGSFLNNVAKGGRATKVTDLGLLRTLNKISLCVASVFDLSVCGIDIMYDKNSNKYCLMEINTNPEWKSFQAATKINVAEDIISYCISLYDRKRKNVPVLVKKYFDKNYDYLDEQKFHYASRMWLWTKGEFYRKKLDSQRVLYLADSLEEQVRFFQKILEEKCVTDNLIASSIRKKYFRKYPNLLSYSKILFKHLFSETIYNEDLTPAVEMAIGRENIRLLKEDLEKDKKAIIALSTFAVNFIYLADYYLNKSFLVNPQLLLDIFCGNKEEIKEHPNLMIYIITHAIIGETRFYSQKILRHRKIYYLMITQLEKLIKERYFKLSLDIKFEFLVCCKLCSYGSVFKDIILGEANRSLADNGNFLVSKFNDSRGRFSKNILDAEHRNVLYLMANLEKNC